MLGTAPSGAPVFISDLYTGSISDKDITKQSGILELLKKGDDCMVDKGFNIKDLLEPIALIGSYKRFDMQMRRKGQFCFALTLSPRLCAFPNKGIFDSRLNSNNSYWSDFEYTSLYFR